MNETAIRGSGGIQWQEPQLTTRVPPETAVAHEVVTGPIARRGERLEQQRVIDFDGMFRTLPLPVPGGLGEWRGVVEGGRRFYAFQRTDGSRYCINLD